MKRFFLIVFFSLAMYNALPSYAQVGGVVYTPFMSVTQRNLREVILEDGIYQVPVQYQSHTGENANYTLNVKIKNDNVVCIYFGNGGYLHNGYNNSGYSWSGGGIQWDVDFWSDQIRGGKAVVLVQYDYGRYQLFTIRL